MAMMRQISVDMFVERYSLSHSLFFRQILFTVNLRHEAHHSILSLEIPEITTCIP